MSNHEAANWPLCQPLKLPIGSFNHFKLAAFKDHMLGLEAANWQHRRIISLSRLPIASFCGSYFIVYMTQSCQLPAFEDHIFNTIESCQLPALRIIFHKTQSCQLPALRIILKSDSKLILAAFKDHILSDLNKPRISCQLPALRIIFYKTQTKLPIATV